MAEATVSLALTKLSLIMERMRTEEASLNVNAKAAAEYLSTQLKEIQNVMADADRKALSNPTIKHWLDRLQLVAYEIEDVVDDLTHEHLKERFEKIHNDESISTNPREKVISFLQSVCLCFRSVDDNGTIEFRFRKLNMRLDSLVKENKKKFKFIRNVNHKPVFEVQFDKKNESTPSNLLDMSSKIEVIGRDDDVRILVNKLLEKRIDYDGTNVGPQVISIVGREGLGKTTVAQLMFRDERVKSKFDLMTWVCVSDPFDQTKIVRAILRDLGLSGSTDSSLERKLQALKMYILRKKFLLVLDGVWLDNGNIWEQIRLGLKNGSPGSKILVTTRSTKIATTIGSHPCDIYHLKVLSDFYCWSILSQMAFRGKNALECEMLEEIGRRIAEKCEGLPLAAKCMGSLLNSTNDRGKWESYLNSNLWESKDNFTFLRICYNELDPVAKRCFSYCAIFLKGSTIMVDKLIRMWMAQGFIPGSDASEVESTAQKYFDLLAALSFLQDLKENGNRIYSCKMNDVIHDFALLLSKNDCSLIIHENTDNIERKLSYKNIRHVNLAVQSPISIYHTEHLRTIIYEKSKPPEKFFNHLKWMRVLNLNGCGIDVVPEEIGRMILLIYLDLSGNHIRELPDTICDLFELQTLDIEDTWTYRLPEGIDRLQKLRHLLIKGSSASEFSQGIEKLIDLWTLSYFRASGTNLCLLKDLNQLRSIAIEIAYIFRSHEMIRTAKEANLKNKKFLRNLGLMISSGSDKEILIDVMEALQPSPSLKTLKIEGPYIPTWITTLTNLCELSILQRYESSSCDWSHLSRLCSLKKLEMQGMFTVVSVGRDVAPIVFPQLQELIFAGCDWWEEWEDISEEEENKTNISIMPCLQRLEINACRFLKTLPHRLLRKIVTLKTLEIRRCPHLKSRYDQSEGEEWDEISHIPNVYLQHSHCLLSN